MKKIVIGLMVVTLTVVLSLSVMAGTLAITGEPLPDGSGEHYAWEKIGNNWVGMGTGQLAANARAWSSGPLVDQSCNKTYWNIPVKVHASVAQWVIFSITGTRYDWRVRKPGEYAANSLTATLQSNSDVEIDFEGFENLKYQGGNVFPGVKQDIDTWYAYGEPSDPGVYAPNLVWIPAAQLNTAIAIVPDSCGLHAGITKKLWNKIKVENCNSACEYEDDAMITLVLMNQKIWINPVTGDFR